MGQGGQQGAAWRPRERAGIARQCRIGEHRCEALALAIFALWPGAGGEIDLLTRLAVINCELKLTAVRS